VTKSNQDIRKIKNALMEETKEKGPLHSILKNRNETTQQSKSIHKDSASSFQETSQENRPKHKQTMPKLNKKLTKPKTTEVDRSSTFKVQKPKQHIKEICRVKSSVNVSSPSRPFSKDEIGAYIREFSPQKKIANEGAFDFENAVKG